MKLSLDEKYGFVLPNLTVNTDLPRKAAQGQFPLR